MPGQPAVKTYPIQTYEVYLGRALKAGPRVFQAIIGCRGHQGDTLGLYFAATGTPLPANTSSADATAAAVYLPAEQFTWYVDLLRNEGPVRAYVNTQDPAANHLYSGPEPVGDAEFGQG